VEQFTLREVFGQCVCAARRREPLVFRLEPRVTCADRTAALATETDKEMRMNAR